MSLTQEIVRELFDYNKETGIFIWKNHYRFKKLIGKRAGTNSGNKYKYRQLTIYGSKYYEHRIAWLYVYGIMPEYIDHKNTNKLDNRISNLRICTQSQNQGNKVVSSLNKSGLKGVNFCKRDRNWRARIRNGRDHILIGYFKTKEEAHDAYVERAKEYFGEFHRAA